MPTIKIKVVCGKGTYIRTLAHDIGARLNSGGHLIKLIRMRIGNFKLDSALTIEDLEKELINL